ncbi:hypothetical protein PoB_001183300 [Plakobranchus ocellatus]|uniref:Uncharacterized protein n=1 Tax=Plakobranchus ocellatus TaxID=259542 RepID=A0AAV3YSU2_9GAST|nr:hypothetical protein PoB_001183300 [Plakobranchus ocellatus]
MSREENIRIIKHAGNERSTLSYSVTGRELKGHTEKLCDFTIPAATSVHSVNRKPSFESLRDAKEKKKSLSPAVRSNRVSVYQRLANAPYELQQPFCRGFEFNAIATSLAPRGPKHLRQLPEAENTAWIYAATRGRLVWFLYKASPQQGDLMLSGPPPGQGASGGARTRNRMVSANAGMDS